MATKRKKKVKRSRSTKKLSNWTLLLMGLGIGIGLTVLVELFVYRASSPGSGLRTLFTRAEESTSTGTKDRGSQAARDETPKPTFDFYTILPEVETVLRDNDLLTERKSVSTATPEAGVSYVLQAASFVNFEDADRLKARLALNGLVPHIQKVSIQGKGEYHRVRLGPYNNLEELNAANRRLRELGIQALRLKVKREG